MKEETVEYFSSGRAFAAWLFETECDGTPARAGVVLLHGGAGLGPHERERARMLADLGYVVFAPDLFGEVFESREHGVAVITRLVEAPQVLRARVSDALSCLRARRGVDGTRVGAIGFCFGGLAALELARSGAELRAAVSFHGRLTSTAPAARGDIRARVLACTGAADPFCPREQRAAFEDEMTAAGVDWQHHIYGGALHGFSVPTIDPAKQPGCAYHALADQRSWTAMRALFTEVL